MFITKTAVVCALVAATASAGATAPNEARDVATLGFGKGTKQSTTKASARPELLGKAPPVTLRPLQKVVDVRGHGRRQGPPMPGLSFFTACRAAVRKCLVVAPRSVLSCVFSMPPSDGAMTRRCMLWIRRRDRAIALLMGRGGKGRKEGQEGQEDQEPEDGQEEGEEVEENGEGPIREAPTNGDHDEEGPMNPRGPMQQAPGQHGGPGEEEHPEAVVHRQH